MARSLPILDNIRVASPCNASWADMTGDDRVRHCAQCDLDVFNLSGMTRGEAEALIAGRNGDLCIRYFHRHDGTIITQDCPVGLAAVARRLRRVAGGLAAAFVCLMGGSNVFGRVAAVFGVNVRHMQPFTTLANWFRQPNYEAMGSMAAPSWSPRAAPLAGRNVIPACGNDPAGETEPTPAPPRQTKHESPWEN
jgi:hypothetical protein